jgi:hypothetical protein
MSNPTLDHSTVDLEALRSGDRAAFARLVELYADSLYNLLLKLTGNVQEAEDALQETFIAPTGLASKRGARSAPGCTGSPCRADAPPQAADTVSIDEPLALDSGG